MKQIPWYDRADIDPRSIKQALSQIYNNTLTDSWLASPLKQKIFVGNHNIECSGGIRESRYRNIKTGAFDGIHLFGSSGSKAYTKSVLDILKQAGLVEVDYDHLKCPQTQFQSQNRGFKKSKTWPFDKDVREPRKKVLKEKFTVPVQNRFAGLRDDYSGNY